MKEICALAVALCISVAYGEEGGATHRIPQSSNIPKQSPFTPTFRGPSAHERVELACENLIWSGRAAETPAEG